MILCDIFNRKFAYFVLYTPIYRLRERKNVSMYKTVHAKIDNVLGPLVHGKVVVEFGRKVFLVECLL